MDALSMIQATVEPQSRVFNKNAWFANMKAFGFQPIGGGYYDFHYPEDRLYFRRPTGERLCLVRISADDRWSKQDSNILFHVESQGVSAQLLVPVHGTQKMLAFCKEAAQRTSALVEAMSELPYDPSWSRGPRFDLQHEYAMWLKAKLTSLGAKHVYDHVVDADAAVDLRKAVPQRPVTATVEPDDGRPETRLERAGFQTIPGFHTAGGLRCFDVFPKSCARNATCFGVSVWVRNSDQTVTSAGVRKYGFRSGAISWNQTSEKYREFKPGESLITYVREALR